MSLASPATDWIQAIGTAVAAAAAIPAFIFAALAYKGQRAQLDQQAKELTALADDRRREADERRRGQAIQVFTWAEARGLIPRGTYDGDIVSQTLRTVHLRNASPLPIRNIEVQFYRENAEWGPAATDAVYLGPGDKKEYQLKLTGEEAVDPTSYVAVVSFNDADGVRWRLNLAGRLEEWHADRGRWLTVRNAPDRQ